MLILHWLKVIWCFQDSIGVKFFDMGVSVLNLFACGGKKRFKQQQTAIYILF
tara:strand:+ start:1774 stop:1929 length:156 start_codon:yes stop_codon:yes gene_type:complete